MLSSLPWIASVLTFATFIAPSHQDTQPSVNWISPLGAGRGGDYSSNWVIKQGDTFKISVSTQATNFDVVIWQNGVRNPYVIKSNTSETNFNWTVDTSEFDVAITPHGDIPGNICYFGITNINGHQEWFSTSHYINVTSPVLDNYYATASLSQPTATSRPQPVSPQVDSHPTSSSPTSPNASMATMVPMTSDDPGSQGSGGPLTGGQAAGIGIGVALGVIVVAAAIACYIFRRRRQNGPAERINSISRVPFEDPEKETWRQMSTASAPGPDQPLPTFAHGAGGDGIRLGAGVPMGATLRAEQQYELEQATAVEMEGRSAKELPT